MTEPPTVSEIAASFWAAHARAIDGARGTFAAIAAAAEGDDVAFWDVSWIWPSAPLRIGSAVRCQLVRVSARHAPLPGGAVRYLVDRNGARVLERRDAT